MHIVDAIFEQLPSTAETARAMHLSIQTVDSWKSSGNIPVWRRAALIDAAKRLGVTFHGNQLAFLAGVERGPKKQRDAA